MTDRPFVTAHWSDLVMLSYAVPDDVLAPYVESLAVDKWEGSGYVSVVGFHFGKMRVLGIDPGLFVPGVSNFAQWNLRAYVHIPGDPMERGIVFIKEFVPHPLVAYMVRTLYNENYHSAALTCSLSQFAAGDSRSDEPTRMHAAEASDGVAFRRAGYRLRAGGQNHNIAVCGNGESSHPAADGIDEFLMERYWGWAASEKRTRFRVAHPPWTTLNVASYLASIDFRLLYGEWWEFLNDRHPDAVTWCEGSNVEIAWRQRDLAS